MERFIACTNPILASFKSWICRSFTSINTCKLTAPNPQISSKNLAKKCKKPINYCKSVEVDAEKCEKIPNQFVFKATYGVAQKRLISKKGKTQKKNYYKKEKYSCFLLSCFANLQWCCGCNRTKSNIGHYFFYNKRIKRNHKSGIADIEEASRNGPHVVFWMTSRFTT